MAEISTVARPYAQAIFELARDDGQYAPWSDMLELMHAVARDPTMQGLMHSPHIKRDDLAELFIGVCGEALDAAGANVVRLLAHNDRLDVLGGVRNQYEKLRAEAEGIVDAELVSAQPVSEAEQAAVAEALQARLGSTVNLKCTTDESLMGGAVIRAGDWVIDGSVRAQLEKLSGALGA